MTDLLENYIERIAQIEERIARACAKSGRDVNEITLVAASKTKSFEQVSEMAKAGIRNFGENRAQELIEKTQQCEQCLIWHFIGKIQTNKLKKIAYRAQLIHSIDSLKHMQILSKLETSPELLIQLSMDGDETRGGVVEKEIPILLEESQKLGLKVVGVMMVPPLSRDPRIYFERAKDTSDSLGLGTLSMGMSQDFELAIECGATIIRIGSALFGAR